VFTPISLGWTSHPATSSGNSVGGTHRCIVSLQVSSCQETKSSSSTRLDMSTTHTRIAQRERITGQRGGVRVIRRRVSVRISCHNLGLDLDVFTDISDCRL